jgi:uncharacterized membrane protein YjjP (DUF1212 family)
MVKAAKLAGKDPRRDALRQLLVELGTAMVAAGDEVDNVEDSLRRIVAAYGIEDVQIALLPTSMFIGMGGW